MTRRRAPTRQRRAPTEAEVRERLIGTWATVDDTAWLWGVSRAQMYDDIAKERVQFPVIKVGRKIRIPVSPLLELLGLDPDQHGPISAKAGEANPASATPSEGVEDDGQSNNIAHLRPA